MFQLLEIVTLILTAVAMALSLAHALEFPGKLRLDRDAYLAMQSIYYPGFTIGGASEPLSILAAIVLLAVTPPASVAFWLVLVALAALIAMHVIFWTVTQRVNKYWVIGENLTGLSASFFGSAPGAPRENWIELRDRWEYSHLARAALAVIAFLALAIAVTR